MQEQVNQQSLTLYIKVGKFSGRVVAKAMAAFAEHQKKVRNTPKVGRQSLKRLERTGGPGDTPFIEVKGRIRSFEAIARKHRVGYHIEKDPSTHPTTWRVHFKANRMEAITGAFTEYSRRMLGVKKEKTSILQDLRQKTKEIKRGTIDKVRNKEMELSR